MTRIDMMYTVNYSILACFAMIFLVESSSLNTPAIPLYENSDFNFNNLFDKLQSSFSLPLAPTPVLNTTETTVQNVSLLLGSPNLPTTTEVQVVQSVYRVPQSFTIFMNFQNDGTTSMQGRF